ncbi:MAG: Preprotein translocase, SecG subunit [Parcubacteria group bacterium Gr01-1014_91]|nr:MAG: Preprotein translocase, SecG subunit [Parcubacteria group bacterium Gr01-1014_91]
MDKSDLSKTFRTTHACTLFPIHAILWVQMEALVSALPYAIIILSILLIVGIVLQQRGASLGGAFGGDNFASTFYKRRGAEKFLFNATVVIAVLLVLAAVANFLLVG